jgi:thiol-disulfide isomerase/thioredoxin
LTYISNRPCVLFLAALATLMLLTACTTAAPPASSDPTGDQTGGAGAEGDASAGPAGKDPAPVSPSEMAKDTPEDAAQKPAAVQMDKDGAPDQPGSAPADAQPAGAPSPQTTAAYSGPAGGEIGDRAAEIAGISAWLNSDPLTTTELRGKVILIDFWTYTCINCIRTYPFLKLWNSRYTDDGLVIIGVHSPEFDFEKDLGNVTQATMEYGIIWPVALDNDFVTWSNYSNRFWPAKYLIDKDGIVRYTHFGEGQYAETENKIRELLKDAGANILNDDFAESVDQVLDPAFRGSNDAEVTRELYAGSDRNLPDRLYGGGGYAGQANYYLTQEAAGNFALPGELTPHQLYFQGRWLVGNENVTHGRVTGGFEDSINMVYSARSVNAVLTSGSGKPYRVRITMDGEYLTADNKGQDVAIGDDGESYILVTGPRIYNVVENPQWVWRNKLTMSSNSNDFVLFAFTFGIYQKAS